ncbi:CpaF family protein [Limnohabitans sp. B9-3]|uniref:CpaF family protein n=1 Tax=Limnohabitans sp. B9-3 TaxID=1100707 RepID=UPI000C1F4C58|nr:CpaF family protein [Limnohabitans sp. B9-3]PIT76289.1 pilus assembly protein CpaF [Limnohabitans sp. B9-3]
MDTTALSRIEKIKSKIHKKILSLVDLRTMESMSAEQLRKELKLLTERLLDEDSVAINESERRTIVQSIQNEMLGLGPIEPLLADTTVSDILVNGPSRVYVERQGRLEATDVKFDNDAHLLRIIDKIVSRIGRRVDELSPMVDARLPDGSRVNAIIAPLALDGPVLSIRRFSVVPYGMDDLVKFGTLTPEMAELIFGLVKAKVNLLVSGGTGSGKTTLLNVISGAIPPNERIITIEDAAELQLQQPHVVRLESRPQNIEGKGEVTQRALLRNSLRMRPDRIILGEIRGSEVLDMLQAMNTGHEGSMTTIHANTPRDALTRLEHMMSMAGMQVSPRAMRQQISAALSVVIQISRLSDGKRKITSLQEITGVEGDIESMQEIFKFDQTGLDATGAVQGRFLATGIRPKFEHRLRTRGVNLREDLYDPARNRG